MKLETHIFICLKQNSASIMFMLAPFLTNHPQPNFIENKTN